MLNAQIYFLGGCFVGHSILLSQVYVHAYVNIKLMIFILLQGSFDSISNCFVVVMVATCLFRYYALCGIVVGLAIHLRSGYFMCVLIFLDRLYPLIFVPTLLLHASHPLPLLSPSFYLKKWDYYRKMVNTVAFRNASM